MKRTGLILLIGALALLILLAASISNFQFAAGRPFFVDSPTQDASLAEEIVLLVETHPLPWLQGIVALGFISLLIYLGYRFYRHITLRLVIQIVLGLLVLFSLAILLPSFDIAQSRTAPGGFSAAATPIPGLVAPEALGRPPQILVGLVIVAVVGAFAWLATKILQKRLAAPQSADPVLGPAQRAVEDLYAGKELRNVVIRCYLQMAQSLQEKHGIQREATMTAREFERWLAYEGFPAAPVHQLTDLFEKMRYSPQNSSSKADEAVAIESLNAIIQSGRAGRSRTDE